MSKWRITLEYTSNDSKECSVSLEDECTSKDTELRFIAMSLAHLFCAFEVLGVTIPCLGKDVLESFYTTFSENWSFWDKKDDLP